MAKVHLPPPIWADYLSGRAALLDLMTDKGRKAAGKPPLPPKKGTD